MARRWAARRAEGPMQHSTAARGHKGLGMNGPIATWYTKNTRKSLAQYIRDARRLAEHIGHAPRDLLEVAPGPGFLAVELARLGHRVVGLDISPSFVQIAAEQARAA